MAYRRSGGRTGRSRSAPTRAYRAGSRRRSAAPRARRTGTRRSTGPRDVRIVIENRSASPVSRPDMEGLKIEKRTKRAKF